MKKDLDLEAYGVSEMNHDEMILIDGGIEYLSLVWVQTDNELVYAGCAVANVGIVAANAGIAVANGAIWLWNQIF